MRLIHYSEKPLVEVYSRPHTKNGAGCCKTPGLWVSVEGADDWVAWCRAESWGVESFKYATEVVLAPSANVLHLSGEKDIDDFSDRFSVDRYQEIDWPEVRKLYQGLIIAPYCWQRRLADHTGWYYGWDCASGVIWDANAIAELRPAELPQFVEP
jgi:hypothetical protein